MIYGKRTTKKHKTFQDDGTLEIVGNSAVLKDVKGDSVSSTTHKWDNIEEGAQLLIGSYEIEIADHVAGPSLASSCNGNAIGNTNPIECVSGQNSCLI